MKKHNERRTRFFQTKSTYPNLVKSINNMEKTQKKSMLSEVNREEESLLCEIE